MATLTSLTAQDARITNLTGLETATNLTTLKLGNNTISNLSALSGLTNLTELQLWDNQITNLSSLAGLTNLTTLFLWGNSISDISHLSGLTSLTQLRIGENSISNISAVSRLRNLTYLSVKENAISDISAVSRLTNLTQLQIGNNTISDITPVQNLTNLEWLDMPNNSISDISVVQNLTQLVELYFQNNAVSDLSPLVTNTGLGTDDELDVQGNPLSYPSIYTHIPALQARNVYIDFDNRVATAPVIISGNTQQGNTGATLTQPFVVEVQDGSSVAFAGVPVTFAVTAGGGSLSATNTTTDVNGRAETTLTLGNTAGTNTVRVSVTGITQTIAFTATATTTPVVTVSPIINRTSQVRDAIVAAVPGVNSASDVTEAHLAAITTLSLNNKNITSLKSGDFDGLSGLTRLVLESNQLTTLPSGIFDGLTALTWLDLGPNRFTTLPSDIFDGLTALSNLDLSNNRFTTLPSDIFDGLTALRTLALHFNQLTTLPMGIFAELSSLNLGLYSNQLTVLPDGLFSGLSSLTSLNVSQNPVDPLPLTVSLEKVGDAQFKAVAPAGAPFEIVLPIAVTNGSISGGTTTLTIPAGSVESDTLTITRTPGTTFAVTVNIGVLPELPENHRGYALVKSDDLPITVIGGDTVDGSVLTLTVGAGPGAALRGYNQHSAPEWDFGSFSPQSFELNGVSYTMYKLTYSVAGKRLALQTIPHLPGGFALHLDAQQFTSVTALDYNQYTWNNVELDWSDGKTVQIGFITTPPMPPGPPTNLQATPGYEKVTLSWIPPANADSIALPITEYEYRISVDGGNTWDPDWETIGLGRTGHNTLTSCTFGDRNNNRNVDNLIDINLTNGTSYTFEIRARGGDGYSDAARITVTPAGSTPVTS